MSVLKLWQQRWAASRENAALKRRAIPDDLWKRTLVRYPFLQRQQAADASELRRLTSLLLDSKEFSTTGGLRLSDAMAVAIAAQAALPVLRMGLAAYDGFVGIIVHPGPVLAQRETTDDVGVVHAYAETLAGEAMQGGPVMLSWPDVRMGGQAQEGTSGYNVVIHEFAHVLDMSNGQADGVPPLPPTVNAAQWRHLLAQELRQLQALVDQGQDTVLDPYAAQGAEEFFAVSSELFFTQPNAIAERTQQLLIGERTQQGAVREANTMLAENPTKAAWTGGSDPDSMP